MSNLREFKPGRGKRAPDPKAAAHSFDYDIPPLDGAPVDGEPECPLIPLGHLNGVYSFIVKSGEKRDIAARDMSTNGILSLCSGYTDWLRHAFPKFDNDGKQINDWSPRSAAAGLMRLCAKEGLWDPATPTRGLGVWLEPDVAALRAGGPTGRAPEPGLIMHVGDGLGFVDDAGDIQFLAVGRKVGRMVYPARPAISRPIRSERSSANGLDEAKRLRQSVGIWNFRDPVRGPALWFGWTSAAFLGGAPKWRPHQAVHGARGSGKSTLMRMALAALGDQSKFFDDFSVAGVRVALTNEARAIVLDEAEGESDRVVQVIDLLRRMSDGVGASSVRATAGQGTITAQVTGMAYMTAINPPMLTPQDRSRITEIELDPADPANGGRADSAIAWATAASGVLRQRALCGWSRFLENFAVYRAAILELEEGGHRPDGRQADQLGTILAAGDMMLLDQPIDAVTAREVVLDYKDYILGIMGQDEEESDARQCLGHLMTSQVESWERGSKLNIGQLVEEAIDADSAHDRQRQALRMHGLAIVFDPLSKLPILLVANKHGGLSRIYATQRWKDGAWKRALCRLPGVEAYEKLVSFAGWTSRCIAIPADHLPEPRAPAQPPDAPPDDDDHAA